jgi:hypothetical protein
MNWDAIGAIAELLGAIGVIASLIYLATQIRQSAKTTRSSVRQSIATRAGDWMLAIAQHDELFSIVRKMSRNEELSELELARLLTALGSVFRSTEEAFLQHQEGLLDDVYWETRSRLMVNFLPGRVIDAWRRSADLYHPDFVDWVERHAKPRED